MLRDGNTQKLWDGGSQAYKMQYFDSGDWFSAAANRYWRQNKDTVVSDRFPDMISVNIVRFRLCRYGH